MIISENALTINVKEMIEMLSKAYVSLARDNIPFKRFPSVMLWGPPGVGKSQGVREIGRIIEKETKKKVSVTDVRLLLFNPVDLRGIPTANETKTLAIWLKPKIFCMDESADVINILFLDEISAAPQSVQAAAYQITLDRTVGEHRLPDNCIVIAAGNRVTDRSVAYNMPKALANRLCHIEISCDADSWHNWAIGAGINSVVLGFLAYNPSMLMKFDPNADQMAFPTPRSWEMVSNILNHVSGKIPEVYSLISGCIGDAAAYELRVWSEIYSKIPDVRNVFEGKADEIPERPEILFALSSDIAAYAREHNSEAEITNAVNYVSKLPFEFKNRIFADFLEIKNLCGLLSRIRVYDDWFMRSGRDWEDYGL